MFKQKQRLEVQFFSYQSVYRCESVFRIHKRHTKKHHIQPGNHSPSPKPRAVAMAMKISLLLFLALAGATEARNFQQLEVGSLSFAGRVFLLLALNVGRTLVFLSKSKEEPATSTRGRTAKMATRLVGGVGFRKPHQPDTSDLIPREFQGVRPFPKYAC